MGRDKRRFALKVSMLQEKAHACKLLNGYASVMEEHFAAYVPSVSNVALLCAGNSLDVSVRDAAMKVFTPLLKALVNDELRSMAS